MSTDPPDEDTTPTYSLSRSEASPPASWQEAEDRAAAGDDLMQLTVALRDHFRGVDSLRADLDTWTDTEETP